MVARRYRLAIHAAFAVLLAGIAVVATGGGAGAASGAAGRPGTYGGDAAAGSIQFRIDKSPLPIPAVTDPFHVWVPYAETSIDSSGGAEGIASTIYPGQDFIGGPNLLCNFAAQLCNAMPGGAPPNYPDWAHAQYPAHPDDSATLSQKPVPGAGAPFEVTPNRADAHADRNEVLATAISSGTDFASVISVGSATSVSHQSFQGGALVLNAVSTIKNIDIGGQLHIDEIRSTTTGKIDGSKIGTATASTTVSGATVAGQGVTIDSKGIHAGPGGDNGLLSKTINSALKQLAGQGIEVRSLPDSKASKPRKVVAETGGVLLTWKHAVSGGPPIPGVGGLENGDYILTISLGGAGLNAFAGPSSSFGGISIPSTPPVSAGGPPPSTSTGGVSTPTTQSPGTPAGQQPAVATNTPQRNAALPIDLTNKRLKTLALVLLGYPLLVLIGAPLRAPARLPRNSG